MTSNHRDRWQRFGAANDAACWRDSGSVAGFFVRGVIGRHRGVRQRELENRFAIFSARGQHE